MALLFTCVLLPHARCAESGVNKLKKGAEMTQAEYKALSAEAKACVQIFTNSYSKVMIFSHSDIEEKTMGSIDKLEPIVNFGMVEAGEG